MITNRRLLNASGIGLARNPIKMQGDPKGFISTSLLESFANAAAVLDRERTEFKAQVKQDTSIGSGWSNTSFGSMEEETPSNPRVKPQKRSKRRSKKASAAAPPVLEKGAQVVILDGRYAGCMGWYNETANRTSKAEQRTNVILEGESGQQVSKSLSKINVKEEAHDHEAEDVFEEALMKVPKLEKRFRVLMRDLAKIVELRNDVDNVIPALIQYVEAEFGEAVDKTKNDRKGWTFLESL